MFVFIENVINQKGPTPDADKSGIDLPFHVTSELKTIPDSRLFNFWYLFYDADSTKAVTFDTKKKELQQPVLNFLKKIQYNQIRELHLSTNLNIKCDLEPLLYNLRHNLRIFGYHPIAEISQMAENQIMGAITIAECQLEEFRFNKDRMGQRLTKKTIIKFLQHQTNSLHVLDLKNWLHQIDPIEIEAIFEEISKMIGLREVKINLILLIRNAQFTGPNVLLPLIEYFKNLETLTIFGDSTLSIPELQFNQPPAQVIQGGNSTSGNTMPMTAWVALAKAIPSTKINLDEKFPIKLDVDESTFDQSHGAELNNFQNVSFRYNVKARDSGWIFGANWKQLKCLKIQDGGDSGSPPFYNTSVFTSQKWIRTFPQLTFVELTLSQLSFPYSSFVNLLFGSPNLANLTIGVQTPKRSADSVIANFDVQDFKTRCSNHRFELTQLVLVNQGTELLEQGGEGENGDVIGGMRLALASFREADRRMTAERRRNELGKK